jgi:hypothetical protein
MLYNLALDRFLAQALVDRLENAVFDNLEQLRTSLHPGEEAVGPWVDLAGLIAPRTRIFQLVEQLENHQIGNLATLNERLRQCAQTYTHDSTSWALSLWLTSLGITRDQATTEDILSLLEAGKKAENELADLAKLDASKEFAPLSHTGYGRDGCETERKEDFTAVQGSFQSHKFLLSQQEHLKRHALKTDVLIDRIRGLASV